MRIGQREGTVVFRAYIAIGGVEHPHYKSKTLTLPSMAWYTNCPESSFGDHRRGVGVHTEAANLTGLWGEHPLGGTRVLFKRRFQILR